MPRSSTAGAAAGAGAPAGGAAGLAEMGTSGIRATVERDGRGPVPGNLLPSPVRARNDEPIDARAQPTVSGTVTAPLLILSAKALIFAS
jgi:hypothetical protein